MKKVSHLKKSVIIREGKQEYIFPVRVGNAAVCRVFYFLFLVVTADYSTVILRNP